LRLILSVTVPIYLLIALGWLAVRSGLFQKAEMRVLGKLVVHFCLPALVFTALASRRFDEVLHPGYLAAYAGGSLAVQLGLVLWLHRGRGLPLTPAALRGMGASCSNSGFVGFPIVQQLLGPVAGLALALNMLVENLLVLPLALALADRGRHPSSHIWPAVAHSLRALGRNPLILGIAAGMVCSVTGWQLPEPLMRSVQMVSTASAPLALFLIGGTLVGLRVRGLLGGVLTVAAAKLLLMPLAVLGLLWLLPPLDPTLRTAALLSAAMPMLSVYPVLAQRYDEEDFCAAALLATTVLSFFTISALIGVLGGLDGWLPATAH
jgi:malonate transporter and related proteins